MLLGESKLDPSNSNEPKQDNNKRFRITECLHCPRVEPKEIKLNNEVWKRIINVATITETKKKLKQTNFQNVMK